MNTKRLLILIVLCATCALLGALTAYAYLPSTTPWVLNYPLPSEYSWIVNCYDNGTYFTVSGCGQYYFQSDLNDSTVIQYAINDTAIEGGGTVFVHSGSYNATVTVKNSVCLILDYRVLGVNYTLEGDASCMELENVSESKFGDSGNYAHFEADGTLVFEGNATVWVDSAIEATALAKGASSPDMVLVNDTNIYLYGYDGQAINESMYGSLEIAHDYKEGTDRYPHVHWMATTDDTGDVTWILETAVFNGSGCKGHVTTTVTDAAAGAWIAVRSDFPAINGTNIKIGDQLIFSLSRTPAISSDTYTHDAVVTSIGAHYQVDMLGSREMTTK